MIGPLPVAAVLRRGSTTDCDDCPPSAILGRPTTRRSSTIVRRLTSGAGRRARRLRALRPAARWQRARRPQRRALAPVLWSGVVPAGAARRPRSPRGGRRPGRASTASPTRSRILASPSRRTRSCSGSCAPRDPRRRGDGAAAADGRHAGPAAGCGRCSPSALGDRSLRVLYWLDEQGGGGSTRRPARVAARRRTTRRASWTLGGARGPAGRRDRPRPRAAATTRSWSRSVAAAAGLAIQNERLEAQLRARVEELRASRARIVEAGDRRAPPARAQPARRRPAAARRALALAARGPEEAAHAIPTWPSRCSPAPRRSSSSRSRSCASSPAASTRPCSPTAACSAALEALAGRSPVPGRAGRHAAPSGCRRRSRPRPTSWSPRR